MAVAGKMPFDRIAEILPWVITFIQSDSDCFLR